jgi:hypothetical protein
LAVILAGIAAALLVRLIAWAALGLAFHRLLDDGHSLLQPAWRRWRLSAQGRLHARIRRRDGYVCRMCGASSVLPELHHLVPESLGGPDRPDNLISVCRPCHRQLHLDTPA